MQNIIACLISKNLLSSDGFVLHAQHKTYFSRMQLLAYLDCLLFSLAFLIVVLIIFDEMQNVHVWLCAKIRLSLTGHTAFDLKYKRNGKHFLPPLK